TRGASAILGGRLLFLADDLPVDVGGGHADVGSPDVEAHDEAGPVADDVRHRLATAATLARASRMHEVGLLQPANGSRDRRLREVHAGGDLGAGGRSLAEDRLEDLLLAWLSQEVGEPIRRARRRAGSPLP